MKKNTNKALNIILLLLSAASIVIKIHLGFDCDEQYAFSMMYRFSKGQMYLRDVLDPYQFSALLMTPLFMLCRLISVPYTVLLFRIFSALLYFLGSIPVYRFLKNETGDTQLAFLDMLFFFTLTPKSIISLEHSNLSALFLTYVLIDFYHYLKYGELQIIPFAIKSLLLAICYPTLTLLVIPVLIILLRKKAYQTAGSYLLAIVVMTLLLILPVLIANEGLTGFAATIRLILMGGSHQFSLANRILSLRSEFRYIIRFLLVSLFFFVTLFVWKHCIPRSRIKEVPDQLLFCTSLFLTAIRPILIASVSPIAGYYSYSFLLLIAMYDASKNNDKPLKKCLLVLFLALIIMFNTSNNGIMAVSGFCAFAMLAAAILWKNSKKGITLLLCTAILCQTSYNAISYHVTGGGPRSVFHFDLVSSSVIKGIWTEQADEDFFKSCAAQPVESQTGLVMVAGTDSYAYLLLDGEVFSPSTTGTPVYGDQMKMYLQRNDAEDFDLIVEKKFPNSSKLIDILRTYYQLRLISSDEVIEHYVAIRNNAQ